MDQPLYILAIVITGVLSSARLTRLLTQDTFPLSVWMRIKWDDWTKDTALKAWNDLLHCHWCMGPWTTAFVGLTGWLSDWHTAWWVFNIWLAASYLNSMVVERDEVRD